MSIRKKIFLASSFELREDRVQFELFIGRKNKDWEARGVFLELVIWEDFFDAMSRTRLQDEYNRAVRECDLFVMLYCTKVGPYTAEEFGTAFGQFRASGKPFLFLYAKDAQISTGSANRQDLNSLWDFQDKLKALGHFPTSYKVTEGLLHHFHQQLDKLVANGFIQFPPAAGGAASHGSTVSATTGGVAIGGPNHGNINTGTQIHPGHRGAGDDVDPEPA